MYKEMAYWLFTEYLCGVLSSVTAELYLFAV
jgi:hypothetical protein